ncbi:MAG: cysteine peptidase family C39 domain-containing protein [Bacteroidota bacterium]
MKNTNSALQCVEHICKHYKLRTLNIPVDENTPGIIDTLKSLDFSACDIHTDTIGLIDCPPPVIIETVSRFMVVIKTNSVGVTVMDPIDGNIHRIAYHDLIREWTGKVILIEPPQKKKSFFERLLG